MKRPSLPTARARLKVRRLFGSLAGYCLTPLAFAQAATPLSLSDFWGVWNWSPPIVLGLLYPAGLYGLGIARLWRQAGVGRGITRWQVAAFGGGVAALFVALVSPLEALSGVLFSAHMVQHLLLILVAAPLLVLGVPMFVWLWALPLRWRRALGGGWQRATGLRGLWEALSQPLLVWFLYTGALWLWHLPSLYQGALRSDLSHGLEHLSFLIPAGLYWWVLLQPLGRRRLSRGAGVLYLFATSLQGSALGLLISFAPTPWYPIYSDPSYGATTAWGLTPLEDQQLAGAIMWMPVGTLYAVLAAVLFGLWLRELEARERPAAVRYTPMSRLSPEEVENAARNRSL
jgi:putative membrane protein